MRRRLAAIFLPVGLLLTGCGGATPSPTGASAAAGPPVPSKPAAGASAAASKPAAAASVAAGPKDKIAVAYTAATMEQMMPMVAKDVGLFDRNGLDVEVTAVGAGSNPGAAVLAGQLQVYQAGPEVIQADLAGADLVYIASPSTAFNFWLFSIPSITDAAGLKGKKIAVTSLTSSTYTAARLAVRSLKLDPDTDVVYTAVNNPPAILAAMQNGAVQAGAIGSTNIVGARKAGMHELVDVAATGVSYPVGWAVTSRAYIAAHRDVIARFMKAYVQAMAYQVSHPEETQKLMGKWSKNEDTAFLKANYDMVAPQLRKVPSPSIDGVKNALEEIATTNPQAKSADPASFVDDSFVRELESSGFIAAAYK